MTYLFDTDHITFMQSPLGPEFGTISRRIAQHAGDDFAFSIVSFHEQSIGAHSLINRARSTADMLRGYLHLSEILRCYLFAVVIPYEKPAEVEFVRLRSMKVRISTMDLRIAAIALTRGFVLVSRKRRDFQQVPGLQFEDWTV